VQNRQKKQNPAMNFQFLLAKIDKKVEKGKLLFTPHTPAAAGTVTREKNHER